MSHVSQNMGRQHLEAPAEDTTLASGVSEAQGTVWQHRRGYAGRYGDHGSTETEKEKTKHLMTTKDKSLLKDIERIKKKYTAFKGMTLPDAILRVAAELERRIDLLPKEQKPPVKAGQRIPGEKPGRDQPKATGEVSEGSRVPRLSNQLPERIPGGVLGGKMLNLFGEDQEPDKKVTGHFKTWRQRNGYKKSVSFEKQCRICRHLRTFEYHDKNYHKCGLQGVSHSEASDIRLGNVCNLFERESR